jgi:hypothetical protein
VGRTNQHNKWVYEEESYVEYNYPKAKQKSQDGASMTTTTQEGKTRIFLSYKSAVIVETDRYRFVPHLFGFSINPP